MTDTHPLRATLFSFYDRLASLVLTWIVTASAHLTFQDFHLTPNDLRVLINDDRERVALLEAHLETDAARHA